MIVFTNDRLICNYFHSKATPYTRTVHTSVGENGEGDEDSSNQ